MFAIIKIAFYVLFRYGFAPVRSPRPSRRRDGLVLSVSAMRHVCFVISRIVVYVSLMHMG